MAEKKLKKDIVKPSAKSITKPRSRGLSIDIVDTTGKKIQSFVLPDTIFKVAASDRLLAQYVRVYLANQCQGTAATKTRSEIVGSTRKIYKQKGTGRARHGARSAPIFVGGGVTHGPHPRSSKLKLNKKQRKKALLYALTKRYSAGDIRVIDGIEKHASKTKELVGILKELELNGKKSVLLIFEVKEAQTLKKVASNIPNISYISALGLNAYEVLRTDTLVFTKQGLQSFINFREKKHES
ncbi:MAG: 50S ribosomal protein L4 [Candidatus Paceibacterota bacterium]